MLTLLSEIENLFAVIWRSGLPRSRFQILDLLAKANLTKTEIKQIKKASIEVLAAMEEKIKAVHDLLSKQSTRDGLRTVIYNFLFDEATGLPVEKFAPEEIDDKRNILFNYFEQTHLQAA